MIRSHFGLEQNPFDPKHLTLLPQQQEIFDTLRVHCQQGGLCLLLGEPGTGKSAIKSHLQHFDPKNMIVPSVSRTLHSYFNTLRILCQCFKIDFDGGDFKCEKRLIEEAFRLNHLRKLIVPLIDDAHLLDIACLRKLRLLFEDFPKNHNLILIGQPCLLNDINLTVNADIKSRITYSVLLPKLNPEQLTSFITKQLDICGLPHNTFDDDALALVVRSSDGILRKARNLCLSALLQAVRDRTKTISTQHINAVLMQPHWRSGASHQDIDQQLPILHESITS